MSAKLAWWETLSGCLLDTYIVSELRREKRRSFERGGRGCLKKITANRGYPGEQGLRWSVLWSAKHLVEVAG